MKVRDEPQLPLASWVVLCLVCERPVHGFAAAALLARDGDLGQVWQVQKAVVYRSMVQLEQCGYIRVIGKEPSRIGPTKSLSEATPAGQLAAGSWLDRPVDHPREVRSELLIKLALRDRIGADAAELLMRQQTQFEPIAAALGDQLNSATGFQRTLALWRSESISATMRFLAALS